MSNLNILQEIATSICILHIPLATPGVGHIFLCVPGYMILFLPCINLQQKGKEVCQTS
jgi:hypothetical protein